MTGTSITTISPHRMAHPLPSPRHPPPPPPPPTRRAYVTMATGDAAGRNALVLVQSLRDVGSTEEILVLASRGGSGSAACRGEDGGAWHAAHPERVGKISCTGPHTVAEEILSPHLLTSLSALGAEVRVFDPIPLTNYTKHMPGGTTMFWGMALNKLVVFNLTEYAKIVVIDSDTMALVNLDHLFDTPAFTASVTHSCCNRAAPGVLSGGLWVLEPSHAQWANAQRLMATGSPVLDHGAPVLDAAGAQVYEHWKVGELNIVRAMVTNFVYNSSRDVSWPAMEDYNHGYVPGLALLPEFSPDRMREVMHSAYSKSMPHEVRAWEGFNESVWVSRGRSPATPWRALSLEYDQCAMSICDCLPGRFTPWAYKSIHFSCARSAWRVGG